MKSKKMNLLIIILISSFVFSVSCDSSESNVSSEIISELELNGIEESLYYMDQANSAAQTENPLLSTYSEGPYDGYSWRRREITYDPLVDHISKEMLVSTIWVFGILDGYRSKLIFFLDDVFKAGGDQGGVMVTGTYEIIDEYLIRLSVTESAGEDYELRYLAQATEVNLHFHRNNELFWQQHYLQDENQLVTWYALGSEPKENSVFTIDDVKVTRKSQVYVAKENVKFRSGPGIEYDSISLNNRIEESFPINLDFLPAGETFLVEAVTTNSYPVSQWNAPWFFIRYPVYHDYALGWVYGEFIIPYDESDKELYATWRATEWKKIWEPEDSN